MNLNERLALTRRAALLGLGGAALSVPVLDALSSGADKTKDKAPDKAADKAKDKAPDKAKDKDKTKDKDKEKDKDKDKDKDHDKMPKGGGEFGGYGGHVTGGGQGKAITVTTARELAEALKKGNCVIHINAKEPLQVDDTIKGASNITLDGGGATLRGDKLGREKQMLHFEKQKNIIVRNIRLRNGGDNISFKTSSDILIHHVSSTGSGDDGMSIAYGTKNVTVAWCFTGGCTRNFFCKYQHTAHLTFHHNLLCKFWIRGPMLHEVEGFDFRNNVIREWHLWGSRAVGKPATGNFVGNVWICPKESKSAIHENALSWGTGEEGGPPGPVYIAESVFKNCKGLEKGTSDKPIDAPAIPGLTKNLETLEHELMSDTHGAGCMPRDKVDKLYLTTNDWTIAREKPFRIPETGKPMP